MHIKWKLHNFIHPNEEMVVAIKSNTLPQNYQICPHTYTTFTHITQTLHIWDILKGPFLKMASGSQDLQ